MGNSTSPTDDIQIGKMVHAWADANKISCQYSESTSSTNKIAKEIGLGENDFYLVITDHQTQGRGRGQNTWSSEKGSSLLSTWCFTLNSAPQPIFSARIGLAVFRALHNTWPFLKFSIKAPNDIYLEDKKLAGLLVENTSQDADHTCYIGLGLNVFKHPESITTSTSLLHSLPKNAPLLGMDWIRFLDRLLFELSEAVELCSEPLSTTDQESLRYALNLNPNLKFPILSISEAADLKDEHGIKPWQLI